MDITLHSGENSTFLTNKSINRVYSSKSKLGQSIRFNNPAYIIGRSGVVGKKEGDGPVGNSFDEVFKDIKMGQKTFEKAELKMLDNAIRSAIKSCNKKLSDIELLFAGDLLNQITSSSYIARDLQLPFMGLYSACSTMSQSLLLASTLIDSGHFNLIACATSSHFATAERQYRFPLEYGCQRPPYAQWTVTGAACSVLSSAQAIGNEPKITMATVGKVVDFGIDDVNNMGAAMAPAAMDSLLALFKENNLSEKDFDLIITGDLGKLGSDILRDLMREQGYELGKKYVDCGNMIYKVNQNCYQGGSGAACSATIMNTYFLDKMESGEYHRIAYFATGALMSPQTCFQGETIPCVSHGVVIENS